MPFDWDARDAGHDFDRDGTPLDGAALAERLREIGAELDIGRLRLLVAYAERLRR